MLAMDPSHANGPPLAPDADDETEALFRVMHARLAAVSGPPAPLTAVAALTRSQKVSGLCGIVTKVVAVNRHGAAGDDDALVIVADREGGRVTCAVHAAAIAANPAVVALGTGVVLKDVSALCIGPRSVVVTICLENVVTLFGLSAPSDAAPIAPPSWPPAATAQFMADAHWNGPHQSELPPAGAPLRHPPRAESTAALPPLASLQSLIHHDDPPAVKGGNAATSQWATPTSAVIRTASVDSSDTITGGAGRGAARAHAPTHAKPSMLAQQLEEVLLDSGHRGAPGAGSLRAGSFFTNLRHPSGIVGLARSDGAAAAAAAVARGAAVGIDEINEHSGHALPVVAPAPPPVTPGLPPAGINRFAPPPTTPAGCSGYMGVALQVPLAAPVVAVAPPAAVPSRGSLLPSVTTDDPTIDLDRRRPRDDASINAARVNSAAAAAAAHVPVAPPASSVANTAGDDDDFAAHDDFFASQQPPAPISATATRSSAAAPSAPQQPLTGLTPTVPRFSSFGGFRSAASVAASPGSSATAPVFDGSAANATRLGSSSISGGGRELPGLSLAARSTPTPSASGTAMLGGGRGLLAAFRGVMASSASAVAASPVETAAAPVAAIAVPSPVAFTPSSHGAPARPPVGVDEFDDDFTTE